jgi:predicted RNA binding protein YcfA (HicA-like mRNA interferase family)
MRHSELFMILKKEGLFEVRQTGSHINMKHPDKPDQLTVPFHKSKEVNKGLLTALMKQAKIKISKR